MRRAAVLLLLLTACLRPSSNKTTGYVLGGIMAGGGAALVGLSLVRDCGSHEGLFNSCEFGKDSAIALGAILGVLGLIKLGVELATPVPATAPVASAAGSS